MPYVTPGYWAAGYAEGELSSPSTGMTLTQDDVNAIALAIISALQATAIPTNVKLMNDEPIIGDGTEANKWRGTGVPN